MKAVARSRTARSLDMRKEAAQLQSQHLLSHQGVAVTPGYLSERPGAGPLTRLQTPATTPSRPAICKAAHPQTVLQLRWSTTRSMLAVKAYLSPSRRRGAVILKSQQPLRLGGLQMTRPQIRLERLGRWLRLCWLP